MTETIAQKRQEISSLYVLKAFVALVVINYHAPLEIDWLYLPGVTTEIFFAITGYFLYSSDISKVQERIKGSVKKVLPIILITHLVYYPLDPIQGSIKEQYIMYFRWLVQGMPPAAGHLWYL